MKQITKIFALAVIMIAFSVSTFAQATTQATASATIVIPMTITRNVDMNFGSVVPNTGGTVILTPAGSRSTTGTVALFGGTVAAARFTVTGSGTSTYAITLPTADHIISSGANTMIVNAFSSTPSGTGALTAGSQILLVGATLNVTAAQPVGTYTNVAGFDVTVNYN